MPECPNLACLLERLGEVTDLPVTTPEIRTDEDAVAAGMAGSPTLLVNGVDPFASSDREECSVSCRLYRDETGRIVTVPRPMVPALGDDPRPCTMDALPQATTHRRPPFVVARGRESLEESSTSTTHSDLGMGTQPRQVMFGELCVAAPTP